jgi:NADPH-dependent 2,4-dienoyl-CoA reductase/sulfur reductase-like enzyme
MIIGGGAAGMQAAITAVARGHEVSLYEKDSKLGGTLNHAADLEFKKDLQNFREWLITQASKRGAKIYLNTEVTQELVKKEAPDAMIIAVGATPIIPKVKGYDLPHVHWAGDVDCGRVAVGKKVAVIGGGLTGAESAVALAMEGKEVTLVEMQGPDMLLNGSSLINRFSLQSLLAKHKVRVVTNTKLEEITDHSIKTINSRFKWEEFEVDTVAFAVGMRPRKDVVNALRHEIPETEVYVIGDGDVVGNVFSAVHAGFNTAVDL